MGHQSPRSTRRTDRPCSSAPAASHDWLAAQESLWRRPAVGPKNDHTVLSTKASAQRRHPHSTPRRRPKNPPLDCFRPPPRLSDWHVRRQRRTTCHVVVRHLIALLYAFGPGTPFPTLLFSCVCVACGGAARHSIIIINICALTWSASPSASHLLHWTCTDFANTRL